MCSCTAPFRVSIGEADGEMALIGSQRGEAVVNKFFYFFSPSPPVYKYDVYLAIASRKDRFLLRHWPRERETDIILQNNTCTRALFKSHIKLTGPKQTHCAPSLIPPPHVLYGQPTLPSFDTTSPRGALLLLSLLI